MTTSPPAAGDLQPDDTVLAPRPWVPLGVLLLAAGSLALRPVWGGVLWLAALLGLFSLFLFVQTALLRLEFSSDALLIRFNGSVIRRFPYAEWLAWRLFWPPLPVLFYFREQRSIHSLPVLFDATALRAALQRHLPHLDETASP